MVTYLDRGEGGGDDSSEQESWQRKRPYFLPLHFRAVSGNLEFD